MLMLKTSTRRKNEAAALLPKPVTGAVPTHVSSQSGFVLLLVCTLPSALDGRDITKCHLVDTC